MHIETYVLTTEALRLPCSGHIAGFSKVMSRVAHQFERRRSNCPISPLGADGDHTSVYIPLTRREERQEEAGQRQRRLCRRWQQSPVDIRSSSWCPSTKSSKVRLRPFSPLKLPNLGYYRRSVLPQSPHAGTYSASLRPSPMPPPSMPRFHNLSPLMCSLLLPHKEPLPP
ncbi:hypothetical protein FKP32DRAFT_1413548 [Trametes sanguinea]|nr:hypothetical protein FKP32DRAFT_1413548 [Trametes sanguinea]